MGYQPIENYGIVGDLNTIALVGLEGSVDFMCFPQFDSPSIFARLLDDKKGGYFSIHPQFKEMKTRQLYLPDTNVLLTRFLSVEGVGEIVDFMPVRPGDGKKLIRRLTSVRGEVNYRMACCPRFDYGRAEHTVEQRGEKEVIFRTEHLRLRLRASVPMEVKDGDVFASFRLSVGERVDFLLEEEEDGLVSDAEEISGAITASLFETIHYWKDWMSRSTYKGRWMETVGRSALILKLLTSSKYGSIIAAPTFGLPEFVGGDRNWDYRYTWIRDASFTVYAFIRLGYTKEAEAFMNWIEKLCRDIKGQDRLGIMYSIDGNRQLEETQLDDFEGYKQSRPVRVGNDAYGQLQLDIYGELMDSVYLYNKYVEPISHDFWKDLERQIDWLSDNWDQPDDGIWEVRGGAKKFLCSRLGCWVALDRGIKIAKMRSLPYKPHWREQRDKIYQSIFDEFWDEKKQAFMQFPGAETVDASSLLMPLFRFISPKDPRWLSTLKRIEEELVTDSLVYRYRPEVAAPDGLVSKEGTFSMCTFWYVECLSRSGQLDKARFYFEKMLGYANHLGLYSEQLGFTGEHLGNFPQAFTHLGLISAAYNMNKQFDDNRNKNINLDQL
ncbi:MAG: glycoside hydrolase family 15 protein [Bacteroidetes bacterium]|nr:glycoside hydrolase family 15 protein [Bacteroidota bacterium]